MNQAIQFIDRLDYKHGALTFYAQVSGLLVPCIIAYEGDEQSAEAYFNEKRFDYEEAAEQLIEDEAYNDRGEIEVPVIG